MEKVIKKMYYRHVGLLSVGLISQVIMMILIVFLNLNLMGIGIIILIPTIHFIYAIVNCILFYQELRYIEDKPLKESLQNNGVALILGIFIMIAGIIGYCLIIHKLREYILKQSLEQEIVDQSEIKENDVGNN